MANTAQPQQSSKSDTLNPERSRGQMGGDVSQSLKDISDQAQEYVSDLGDQAREVYDTASDWVRENRNTVFIALGAIAAIGLVAYLVSRNRYSMYDRM